MKTYIRKERADGTHGSRDGYHAHTGWDFPTMSNLYPQAAMGTGHGTHVRTRQWRVVGIAYTLVVSLTRCQWQRRLSCFHLFVHRCIPYAHAPPRFHLSPVDLGCHIPYDRPSQLWWYSPLPTPLETNSGMFSPRTCFRTSGHVLGSPLVILHFSYLLLY